MLTQSNRRKKVKVKNEFSKNFCKQRKTTRQSFLINGSKKKVD
jgi:hypothetical protein